MYLISIDLGHSFAEPFEACIEFQEVELLLDCRGLWFHLIGLLPARDVGLLELAAVPTSLYGRAARVSSRSACPLSRIISGISSCQPPLGSA